MIPANGFRSPSTSGRSFSCRRKGRTSRGHGPDLARAKALIAGRSFDASLYITTDPAAQLEAVVIQQNLKAIGIAVNVTSYTFGALLSIVGHKATPYDMVLIGWASDYADPDDFINVILSAKNITPENNINLPQFDEPVFQRRMD